MDFWDMAKLTWRRWYVTLPLLLLTAAAVAMTFQSVDPDYRSTDYIAVLPPVVERSSDEEVTRVNPWSEESLADAAAIRLMGKQVADDFEAAGYDAEWTVEVTGRLPVIRVEVVAPTAEQATAAMEDLLSAVEEEVQGRQASYDIPEGEQITTVRYDEGEILETVTSKLKRALVVVAAIGLILTMAAVVSVDAFARRREAKRTPSPAVPPGRARRYEFATALDSERNPEPRSPEPRSEPRTQHVNGREHAPEGGFPAFPPAQAAYDDVPYAGHRVPHQEPREEEEGASTRPTSPGPVADVVPGPHPDKVVSSARMPTSPAPGAVPDDSTIVLPLAGLPRSSRRSHDD